MMESTKEGNTEVVSTDEQAGAVDRITGPPIHASHYASQSSHVPHTVNSSTADQPATIERNSALPEARSTIPRARSAIPESHSDSSTVHSDSSAVHSETGQSLSVCDVLVAIPAYNEGTTIGEIVRRAGVHADQVLVVDDGSTDDTATRAATAGATVIEHRRNRGYGAALKTAFEEARRCSVEHLVILDGDGQHDPADIPRLVAAQERTDAHLVIGSRFIDGATSNAPFYRRIGLRTINILTNLSLGSGVSDTQSGFRAYDREAIESLAADRTISDWMDASTDILYHAHHHSYTIEEVAIAVEYDVTNASSQMPLSHGVSIVRNILKTIGRDRPLTALFVPGFGLTVGGVGVGYWALATYSHSGTLPAGLSLTAAFFILIGIFICFAAIVLYSLDTYFSKTERGGVV